MLDGDDLRAAIRRWQERSTVRILSLRSGVPIGRIFEHCRNNRPLDAAETEALTDVLGLGQGDGESA